jgi:hypothetical protein
VLIPQRDVAVTRREEQSRIFNRACGEHEKSRVDAERLLHGASYRGADDAPRAARRAPSASSEQHVAWWTSRMFSDAGISPGCATVNR